jgi:F-type H+-transporting ATPase subunit alpha
MPVGEQIAILYCGTKALLKDLALDQIDDFQTTFLSKMRAFHSLVREAVLGRSLPAEFLWR